jgi:hypothetical protein
MCSFNSAKFFSKGQGLSPLDLDDLLAPAAPEDASWSAILGSAARRRRFFTGSPSFVASWPGDYVPT